MAGVGTRPFGSNHAASVRPDGYQTVGKQDGGESYKTGLGPAPQVPRRSVQTFGRNTGALSGKPISRTSRRGRSG